MKENCEQMFKFKEKDLDPETGSGSVSNMQVTKIKGRRIFFLKLLC